MKTNNSIITIASSILDLLTTIVIGIYGIMLLIESSKWEVFSFNSIMLATGGMVCIIFILTLNNKRKINSLSKMLQQKEE